MGQKQKLIARLLSEPNDFTFDEAERLLGHFGYHRFNKGKTSGSRVMFVNCDHSSKIRLHKPHPGNVLKKYQVKQLIDHMKQEGLL